MFKKIRIRSPANIAFIKYWGQKDERLILPYNDSFSMNLSHCFTEIDLELYQEKKIQELYVRDYQQKSYLRDKGEALLKVKKYIKTIENFFEESLPFGFKIYSYNSFPKKAGIASSASFFSGLALAFVKALNKSLSQKKLSILARLSGSGSACRSIPDGFVWWKKGRGSDSSFAYSIAPPDFWNIRDIVLILNKKEKKVSSLDGHKNVLTSPFFKFRLLDLNQRLKLIKKAFLKKDFTFFGILLEEEALSMHFVMMTQKPPLFYWSGKTIEIIKEIVNLRKKGTEAYFTIDAGENIHLICLGKDVMKIKNYFSQNSLVQNLIINQPVEGTRLIDYK